MSMGTKKTDEASHRIYHLDKIQQKIKVTMNGKDTNMVKHYNHHLNKLL